MRDKTFSLLVLAAFVIAAGLSLFAGSASTKFDSISVSAVINTYVETNSNESSITFGNIDPPKTNITATSNPLNYTLTTNSNTAVDVYLNATDFSGAGTITKGNLTASKNLTAPLYSQFNASYLSGAGPNNGFKENLAPGAFQLFYFNLSVPNAQPGGSYSSTLYIKAVADGGTP